MIECGPYPDICFTGYYHVLEIAITLKSISCSKYVINFFKTAINIHSFDFQLQACSSYAYTISIR